MSDKEEKKVEVKQLDERSITPLSSSDIFQAFDEMWEEFRRDFLRSWRPWRFRIRPWNMDAAIMLREVCADLIDTGKEYKVCAEVLGIPKDKLDITITKDSVEISGKAEVEREDEEKGYLVRERGYSETYKRIAFPEETLPEKAEATLKNGLLEIKVPKKMLTPVVKKHKVEIK